MIASTPVARWNWGESGRPADLVSEAVHRFAQAVRVLDQHRLGTPHEGRVAVAVPERGHRGYLLKTDLRVGAIAEEGAGATEELVAQIKTRLTPSEIGAVELFASCDGMVDTDCGAQATEGMFTLSVEVSEGFFNVGLTAFSDAWMPFDLRGRGQESVFAANGPRLASALAELSEALDTEVDPDDPTWFSVPTESGARNHYEDDDGTPSDVWGRFEIPYRNGIFSQTPKFTAGYGRQASGPVQYVPVVGESGVLGYLWASDAESAASFEACDAVDLDGYRAGLVWLDRLQKAYDRGLLPTAALAELMAYPDDAEAGQAGSSEPIDVDEFWKVRELAQS
ncbi:hypothetical protein P3T36_006260 [Kitasatospora sp. MAP12-15]|uniref:hypothetical protein n=1 Tax=unclassified Kitasatospora TaxID=2633591 RepID=UPI002475B549|nr:hypothetical protein [Kitasatospora sp. MAP12-44]MDH6109177.1 hypothetical protein [Kitasatospora sp. MAP12-44]